MPAGWPRLSAVDIAILNRENTKHNKRVSRSPRYPQIDEIRGLQESIHAHPELREQIEEALGEHLRSLGWQGGHELLARPELFDVQDLGATFSLDQLVKGFRQRKSKKGKRRQGSQALLNPDIVHRVVREKIKLSGLQPADMTGPVMRAAQNFLFLTPEKAAWFSTSYKEFIPLAHLWSCSEVTKAGLDRIAADTGYQAYCSMENTRGQAVGILVHPRFQVLKVIIIDEVANVQGVQDLRPVLVLVLKDTSPAAKPNDEITFHAVHHAKSMRGGVERAGAICYLQNQVIVKHLKDLGPGVIGGDFNVLPGTPVGDRVISVLTDGGFVFVDATDRRPTHSMGGRLDLMFTRGLRTEIRIEALLDWFNSEIDRGLSDHAALICAPR